MSKYNADFWIKQLQLTQHIEGGWYSEVYRSSFILRKDILPASFESDRNACTHIYFLLQKKGFSAFHRLRKPADELWHFYAGDPLIVYEIDKSGDMKEHLLGNEVDAGQALFCVIKGGNWFAAKVVEASEYSLVGCTVSPGFDFNDFELAERDGLAKTYPQYTELITSMTNR